MAVVGEILTKISADITELKRGIGEANAQLARFANQAKDSAKDINKEMASEFKSFSHSAQIAFAATAAAMGGVIKIGMDFETQMRNVNSIAKLNDEQWNKLSDTLRDMPGMKNLSQSATELASGMYDVYSSGFQGEEALNILEVSAKGASAGLSNTATSAKALMGVLNAYGPEVGSAQEVMDTMFQTVNLGVLTFEDLASQLGDVISTGAAAKVSFQEISAAIATLTLKGVTPFESVTALNQVLLSIIDPGSQAAKVMKELGLNINYSTLANEGLYETLVKAAKAADGNTQATSQLFGNVRALKGVLALTNDDGKKFKEVLDGINQASGATGRALSEQEKGFNFQLKVVRANLEAIAITFKADIQPALTKMLGQVNDAITSFKNMDPEVRKTISNLALTGVKALGAIAGITLLGNAMMSFARVIRLLLIPALASVVNSIFMVSMGIIGLSPIFGPVAVAVAAFAGLWTLNMFHIRDVTDSIKKSILRNIADLIPALGILSDEAAKAQAEASFPWGSKMSGRKIVPAGNLPEGLPGKGPKITGVVTSDDGGENKTTSSAGDGSGKSAKDTYQEQLNLLRQFHIDKLSAQGKTYQAELLNLEKEREANKAQAKEKIKNHADLAKALEDIDAAYFANKKKLEADHNEGIINSKRELLKAVAEANARDAEEKGDTKGAMGWKKEALRIEEAQALDDKIKSLRESGLSEQEIARQTSEYKVLLHNDTLRKIQEAQNNFDKQAINDELKAQAMDKEIQDSRIAEQIRVFEWNRTLGKATIEDEIAYLRKTIANETLTKDKKIELMNTLYGLEKQQIAGKYQLNSDLNASQLEQIETLLQAEATAIQSLGTLTDEQQARLAALNETLNQIHGQIQQKNQESLDEFKQIYKAFLVQTLSGQKSFGDAFKTLWEGIKNAFITQIAEMIAQIIAMQMKLLALRLVMSMFGFHGGGEVTSTGASPPGGITAHSGGEIGRQRVIPAFHSGLNNDEVLAKLQVGEWVLPRNVVRAIKGGSVTNTTTSTPITVNVFNPVVDTGERLNSMVNQLKSELIYSLQGA